ncbi:hypothetical protein JTE90_003739 [Oedothorax gibbosus]|uniref:tRNA (carboxymethyluridine(34)-5-O)-methyltransferase n=1 Tax=Oedothorax gibbosus TaxID=931172 RepID=A0AAV6VCA5_9ARAC|nr:hypothetical protein JTE90_003739 [Oedothorax gibbosus]
MDERTLKKINRKIKRSEEILMKHQHIKTIVEPSNSLFVSNGGFGCGFTRETLADIFGAFGSLEAIVLLPGEPHSFVAFKDKADAVSAMNGVSGQRLKSGHVLFLAYIANSDLPSPPIIREVWPPGLVLLEDFLTEEEEAQLLTAVNCEDVKDEKAVLKHRKVKHYGYEFVYGSNTIDRSQKLEEDIPDVCLPHLQKLVALGHLARIPDQLTVNHYLPGHGIPPHIDTHSACEDGIVSISLGSQVLMDFYHAEDAELCASVLLPPRSALVMLGESRYLWKHGITPRKTDIVRSKIGDQLTLHQRSTRVSLTFRMVRDGECHCEYKNQCDSQQNIKSFTKDFVNNDEAEQLEKKYVNQVYEDIAHHFSSTRYKPWPQVAAFLASVEPGSLVLDVGCGNGKNMKLSNGCYEVGCDASSNLALVCQERGMEVLVADCLHLPFRDNCADALISIAVIHHMATRARRIEALRELARVLKPGGRALVYVWAFEQENEETGTASKYISRREDKSACLPKEQVLEVGSGGASLPVHRNKTDFRTQDVLVPWKKNQGEDVCHRFYHVFVRGELEGLVGEAGARVVRSYYDEGNWCAVITK